MQSFKFYLLKSPQRFIIIVLYLGQNILLYPDHSVVDGICNIIGWWKGKFLVERKPMKII